MFLVFYLIFLFVTAFGDEFKKRPAGEGKKINAEQCGVGVFDGSVLCSELGSGTPRANDVSCWGTGVYERWLLTVILERQGGYCTTSTACHHSNSKFQDSIGSLTYDSEK